MLNREIPVAPEKRSFSETEREILDRMVKDTAQIMSSAPLEKYMIELAQLTGYMRNKNKYPPGIYHYLAGAEV